MAVGKRMVVEGVPVAEPGGLAAQAHAARGKLLHRAAQALFRNDPEFAAGTRSFAESGHANRAAVDFLFAASEDPRTPDAVFARLRWGGQFIYVSPQADEVAQTARRFDGRGGFVLEREPGTFALRPLGLPVPLLTRNVPFFVARRTLLVAPNQVSARCTYHLELVQPERFGGVWVVMKQVPTLERMLARLREALPDEPLDALRKRARKLVNKTLPAFLTRETAMLKTLQERLPEKYKGRVPRPLGVNQDERGLVRTLYMTWLRSGLGGAGAGARRPLGQLDFALQAADLLRAIHEGAGMLHLDLQLDNIVITPAGVGFVDFGSAARVDEELSESPLLPAYLQPAPRVGRVANRDDSSPEESDERSEARGAGPGKPSPATDVADLAAQILDPHADPDLRELTAFDPASALAKALAALAAEILRPRAAPPCRTARELLARLRKLT